MAIKNVIFDFGQVLVYFQEKYMVDKYTDSVEERKLLSEVIFDRLYWDRLDEGTISNEETVRLCKERLPKNLHPVCEKIYYEWIYNIPEIEGMRELLRYLKKTYGTKMYLLSNISTYFSENKDKVEILKELDGYVFSGEIGITKPNDAIFKHLLDKFSLKAEECIFVDDRRENVEAGERNGLLGYIFDGNAEKLKKYLDNLL